ncbi:MAG: xanthine dehydrogenase accessory protein XdhC [Candidatus Eisenbacteria bacterium]|uniref:Xanthine dehydrogenase accessory protein XdhC n=1 Tax=Eiseniibacteriota bacterium TaxID=2212470 RepID=A0A9D6LBP4_UNCEI|nr:xanthine dehydrogenase accessory protein XdhC [Candidatus Eisenbacteria bacterium]MBI3540198.1 xanthine dehydrogenase accessory protein XdhC [Candidatus Eisenbacteria bacterium]
MSDRPFDALRDAAAGASPPEVWETLARWRDQGRRFALASVIESRGFTPRKPGAHMLVADDGEICGTIGGGAIERKVVDEARALLTGGGATLVRKHLTQELGMCCGGEMAVFLEVLEPAPRLYLFGAGYIGRALASLASGCGFDVTVIDERPEWALPERFPGCRLELRAPEAFLAALATTPRDYAVVVTHDHALDQRLVQDLLERPLAFVGMIGSVAKQRKFALRLRARGMSDERIARLHSPLGMPIGAETPEEIAVSAMGEIIAARRGASTTAGWTPPLPKRERARTEAPATPTGSAGKTNP